MDSNSPKEQLPFATNRSTIPFQKQLSAQIYAMQVLLPQQPQNSCSGPHHATPEVFPSTLGNQDAQNEVTHQHDPQKVSAPNATTLDLARSRPGLSHAS